MFRRKEEKKVYYLIKIIIMIHQYNFFVEFRFFRQLKKEPSRYYSCLFLNGLWILF